MRHLHGPRGRRIGHAVHGSPDARRLDSRRNLAGLRNCSDIDAVSEELVSVSCGRLHAEEIVAYFLVQLPVEVAATTEAQRAPLDPSCRDIATALVGAKRKDLHAFVDAPAGTVIGLGHRSLPA